MRAADTYEFECVCGHACVTTERETSCPQCQRLIVLEWGGYLFDPVTARITEFGGEEKKKHAVVVVGEKAKGASA